MLRFRSLGHGLAVALLSFLALGVRNMLRLQKEEIQIQAMSHRVEEHFNMSFNSAQALRNLQSAVQIPTVSGNSEAIRRFHGFLRSTYPTLHKEDKRITIESVNELSLLYFIRGTNEELKPFLFSNHMDVVPVDGQNWSYPPFGGEIHDEFIYGRGVIDMKGQLIGILESIEVLLQFPNWSPKRSLYIALGHDEEVGGYHGSNDIARLLRSRQVSLAFLIDEGLPITRKIFKHIEEDIAMIGISEKGIASFKISVTAPPGHGSMPPPLTSSSVLIKYLNSMLDSLPEASLEPPVTTFLAKIAPHTPNLVMRFLFANAEYLSPILAFVMAGDHRISATVKTTVSITSLNSSSTSHNTLPETCSAILNIRIRPGNTVKQIQNWLQSLADVYESSEASVSVQTLQHDATNPVRVTADPSSQSSIYTWSYRLIQGSLKYIEPYISNTSLLIAPNLMMANTDSYWYQKYGIVKDVYRMMCFALTKEDVRGIHGVNERLRVKDFFNAVRFWTSFIENASMNQEH